MVPISLSWATLAVVASGGAIGATLRYLVTLGAARLFGAGFPLGVLAANIFGCLAMGVVAAWCAAAMDAPGSGGANRIAPFLMTGLLGGFTTFSAFALDVATLAERGRLELAALYVGASVIGSLIAVLAGLALGRHWFGPAIL